MEDIFKLIKKTIFCLSKIDFNNKSNIKNKDIYPSLNNCPKLELEGNYDARFVDIYDGDTLTCVIKLNNSFYKVNIRVAGIDTPEIRSTDKIIAYEARNRAFEILTGIKILNTTTKEEIRNILDNSIYMIKLDCQKNEKYGRNLAVVYNINGVNLGEQLIKEGYAKMYYGGKKT